MHAYSIQRFVLGGIGGTYNYGCEAIVRGTVEMLRLRWPATHIYYISPRPREDRITLRDCHVKVRGSSYPRWHPKRILRSLLARARLPFAFLPKDTWHIYAKEGCYISIGGDIFTLPPGKPPAEVNERTLGLERQYNLLQWAYRYVLWGASVGPFDRWPGASELYAHFFRKLDLITVREPASIGYLHELGVQRNVVPVGDPAFLMKPSEYVPAIKERMKPNGLIGVNLSPLSLYFIKGVEEEGWDQEIDNQAQLLMRLEEETNAGILLIPHVIDPHLARDDDWRYLERLHGAMRSRMGDKVDILPKNLGARRTKGAIGKCNMLVAARMHCAIAGVSSGVPTLFIGYSQKAKGMAENVYGGTEQYVSLENLAEELGQGKILKMWHKRNEVRAFLEARREELVASAQRGGEALASLVHA